MKPQHSSAQLTPWGIAADGRRAGAPSSSRLASNLIPIHHQIDNHSRGGAPRWGCCGYRPADGRRATQFRLSVTFVSLNTGRGLGLGTLSAMTDRSCLSDPVNHQSTGHAFHNLIQSFPCHSNFSVSDADHISDGAENEVPQIRVSGTPDDC